MKWQRIELPKDDTLRNKIIEKILLPIGTEVVLNNQLVAKVVYNNVGKRRMTLEVVGLVKQIDEEREFQEVTNKLDNKEINNENLSNANNGA